MFCRVYAVIVVLHGLIKRFNIICTDINLTIIFFGVKAFEFKKVNFHIVFLNQYIALVFTTYIGKTQLGYIKVSCGSLAAHGRFGNNGGEHDDFFSKMGVGEVRRFE
jgi:hypothetical protein